MFTFDKDEKVKDQMESKKQRNRVSQDQIVNEGGSIKSESSFGSKSKASSKSRTTQPKQDEALEPWKQHPALTLPGSSSSSHKSRRSPKTSQVQKKEQPNIEPKSRQQSVSTLGNDSVLLSEELKENRPALAKQELKIQQEFKSKELAEGASSSAAQSSFPEGAEKIETGGGFMTEPKQFSKLGRSMKTNNILQFNVSGLEEVLRDITDTLHQHDQQLARPPWLENVMHKLENYDALEARVATLTEEVKRLHKTTSELSTPRLSLTEGGDRSVVRDGLEGLTSKPGSVEFNQYKIKTDGKLSELVLGVDRVTKMMSSALSPSELDSVEAKIQRELQDFVSKMEIELTKEQRSLDKRLTEDLSKLRDWLMNQEKRMSERDQILWDSLKGLVSKEELDKLRVSLMGNIAEKRNSVEDTENKIYDLKQDVLQIKQNNALKMLNHSYKKASKRMIRKAFFKWAEQADLVPDREMAGGALGRPGGRKAKQLQAFSQFRIMFNSMKQRRLMGAMSAWHRFVTRQQREEDRVELKINDMVRSLRKQRNIALAAAFKIWRRNHYEDQMMGTGTIGPSAGMSGTRFSEALNATTELSGAGQDTAEHAMAGQDGYSDWYTEGGSKTGSKAQSKSNSVDDILESGQIALQPSLNTTNTEVSEEIRMFGEDVQGALIHVARHRAASVDQFGNLGFRVGGLENAHEEIDNKLKTMEDRGLVYADSSSMQGIQEIKSEVARTIPELRKMIFKLDAGFEEMSYVNNAKAEQMEKALTKMTALETQGASLLEFQGECVERIEQTENIAAQQRKEMEQYKSFVAGLQERITEMDQENNKKDNKIMELSETLSNAQAFTQSEMDILKQAAAQDRSNLSNVEMIVSRNESLLRQVHDSLKDQIGELAEKLQIRSLLKPEIDGIVHLGIEFENLAVQRTFTPPIPREMIPEIAIFCQEMARYIAELADHEALERTIGGVSVEDMPFLEGEIDARRQELIEIFLEEFSARVEENYANPGALRGEARRIFRRKLKDTLDMALSKHDQVLMPSYTRFEGRKPPVCIACDRPLGNKRRVRELPKSPSDLIKGKKPMSPRERKLADTVATGPNSNAATFPSVAGGKVDRKPEGGGGSKLLPISSSPAFLPSKPTNGANFVMRGGFRMSKKTNPVMTQSLNAMPRMINEGSPMESNDMMSRTQEISSARSNNESSAVSNDENRPRTAQPRIKY